MSGNIGFAFGNTKWPGLAKLVEEAGEVLQVCGKLIMTHGEVSHWDGSDLKKRLESELGDLLAAIRFTIETSALDGEAIKERAEEKLIRFYKWHRGVE